MELIELDLRGQEYEAVEARIRARVGLPARRKWGDVDKRAFRGLVPPEQELHVYAAMLFTDRNARERLRHEGWDGDYAKLATLDRAPWSPGLVEEWRRFKVSRRHFRREGFWGNTIMTDKLLSSRRFDGTVVFDTSAYEASTHAFNLELMRWLARVYAPRPAQIISILKDRHEGSRSRPFARDHLTLLVVRLQPGDTRWAAAPETAAPETAAPETAAAATI
jgi:hypothetical protein